MDSSPTSLLLCPSLMAELNKDMNPTGGVVFDSSVLRKQSNIPKEFIWPQSERPKTLRELKPPVINLGGFFRGDESSTKLAAELIDAACQSHGFFQVINHGVDCSLAREALGCADDFFKLPLSQKLCCQKKPGSLWGYTGAHADRFSSKLPWKETFSFEYNDDHSDTTVIDYFTSTMGEEFKHTGLVYQKYCKGMKRLSLAIMELLAIGLGVGRRHYRDFFADSSSIMRCNYYPPCQEPEMTLGTGPHCDPTSLTILQQDHVGGLEVFTGGEWRAVAPVRDAFVINIGDTFMALTNGRYKSCLHRAVVNRHCERKSLAFFLCPREDKIIRPPENIGGPRKYPDFKWSELRGFTQRHYRADTKTLQSFSQWLLNSPEHN